MRRLIAPLFVALVLAACGGSSTSSTPTTASTPTVPVPAPRVLGAHPCSAKDYFMQCALPTPTVGLTNRAAVPLVHGIDFAWGGPSCAALRANGWGFGASYLSYDPSKNWRASQIADYRAHGCKIVNVWETSALRTVSGGSYNGNFNNGFSDAREAVRQAAAQGEPANRPIDFAIDCDCSGPAVAAYFTGADRGAPGRVNAYGGYRPLAYLCAHHLVGHTSWQTYAWSGGAWLPASCAPLEQYLNGSTFDRDRAIAADYGQWPYATTPPRPHTICFGQHASGSAKCRRVRAQVAGYQRAAAASARVYYRRGCGVLAQRDAWFADHLRRSPKVRRPHRLAALRATRRAEATRRCGVFGQRARFFTGRAVAETKRYS